MPKGKHKDLPPRDMWGSLWVGFSQKCPNCQSERVYSSFLKVKHTCDACGQELHHHRADDAPPYFTIFIVGHIIIPLMFFLNKQYELTTLTLLGILIPLTLILSLWLLPRIKGALVGLQWSLYMHGFEEDARSKGS